MFRNIWPVPVLCSTTTISLLAIWDPWLMLRWHWVKNAISWCRSAITDFPLIGTQMQFHVCHRQMDQHKLVCYCVQYVSRVFALTCWLACLSYIFYTIRQSKEKSKREKVTAASARAKEREKMLKYFHSHHLRLRFRSLHSIIGNNFKIYDRLCFWRRRWRHQQ